MKLKYYLRGMGIGIIVTTIILAISFSGREVEISDEQVMVRAAALGMVMPEEEADIINTETGTEAESATAPEVEVETEVDTEIESEPESEQIPETENTQADTYRLVINSGDVCRVVCEKLQANGVIDDSEALRKHLFELGYANSISTGSYDVPYGLTMEEVAQIIVAGPIE